MQQVVYMRHLLRLERQHREEIEPFTQKADHELDHHRTVGHATGRILEASTSFAVPTR